MKKKWWIIVAATIAGCIGLAFVIPALRPSQPRLTKENLDRIEIGMTYDEVEAILGPPVFDPRYGPEFGDYRPTWENERGDQAPIAFDHASRRVKTKRWDEWPDNRTVFEKLMDHLLWRERPVRGRPARKTGARSPRPRMIC